MDGSDHSLGRTRSLSFCSKDDFDQELVGSNPESRNWKGIAIALAVILLVIGLVALSVVIMSPETTLPSIPNVNLSDITRKKWLIPRDTWIGKNLIFHDLRGNVMKLSSPDLKPEVVISSQILKDNGITEYKVSGDGRYALLAYNKVRLYTYSYSASYYVYDIKARTKQPLIHAETEPVFQYAGFGKAGSSILYALKGDLYYKSDVNKLEAKQLTSGGIIGVYQNGIADWLYEEEILKCSEALWWSPSGRYLAYASFDDQKVHDEYVTSFAKEFTSDALPYARQEKYKYPKAGYPIPVVKIHTIDMETFEHNTFQQPFWKKQKLDVFHSLSWLADDELLITWSNRTMTVSAMQQCFPTMATCMDDVLRFSVSFAESKNKKTEWLTNLNQQVLPSDDPSIFFYITPSDHGGMGKFNHLAVINKTEKPSETQFLTSGNWEVTKLLHYDSTTQQIYYISNENHHASRHVFVTDQNGNRRCVTCSLGGNQVDSYFSEASLKDEGEDNGSSKMISEECKYYEATFGSSSEWFSVHCLGPRIPFSGTVRVNRTRRSFEFKILRPPDKSSRNIMIPTIKFGTFTGEHGRSIKIKVLIPAQLHVGKRPVVFFKEDLGSNTVDFKYKVDLASYIVKSIGAVAVFVDGGGSGTRGNRLLHLSAQNPGSAEINDMKEALKYLKSLDTETIDTENAAVIGMPGYGGYTAVLSLREKEFRCAVASSPITDWSLYNSFGSEAMLGSPTENYLLYQKHNLVRSIDEISHSQLRIFHGLQDRKVNMQHSFLLSQAAMLSNLPLNTVSVTFHTTINRLRENEARTLESKIYESTSLFLRNCLLGNDEVGLKKLELLKNDYGIPT